eukprot:TRINITY_DN11459_c0_g1_i5.p1 TRINITY_DN11459_c0_g1~~TRINITY_DN11459_c0_g1_i5.p1  ORF type:complete len:230 (+),score=25.59 TRINITY_DN11459_c0_g1_i5:121-810(+)
MGFYRTLWRLQRFFVDPNQLSNQEKWTSFSSAVERVLTAFENNKIASKEVLDAGSPAAIAIGGPSFPKYLTSSRLISLQLRDPALRRHILLQLIVLFQFLLSTVKKLTFALNAKQKENVKSMINRVAFLLRTTPPDGAKFERVINDLIKREGNWIKWKDNKCPGIQLPPQSLKDVVPLPESSSGPQPPLRGKKASKQPITPLQMALSKKQIGRAVQQECRDRSRMPSSA